LNSGPKLRKPYELYYERDDPVGPLVFETEEEYTDRVNKVRLEKWEHEQHKNS
jgi:hypothetical protein